MLSKVPVLPEQARAAGMEHILLSLDSFPSSEMLSMLLLCSAVFLAPSDDQQPSLVRHAFPEAGLPVNFLINLGISSCHSAPGAF